jgi:hypothetical protein
LLENGRAGAVEERARDSHHPLLALLLLSSCK